MARQTYLTTDPAALKPIAEALIFASEEPLAARLLVRFLAGERDSGSAADDAPVAADTSVEQSEDAVDETDMPSTDEPNAADEFPHDSSENIGELADAIERAEDRASGMLLGEGFGEPIDQRLLRRLIDELNAEYQESGRAFRIVEIAGGFQFATIREYGEYVALLSKEKSRRRLSPAALETLAIIAYRQPVSKPELESIRGVNSDQVLLSLLEKNLIAITGRADSVGRPLLYGTTSEFLRIFGLNSLSDLPRLREIEELMEEDAYSADRVEVITVAESSEVEEIEARVGAAGRIEESRDSGSRESESRESGVEEGLRGGESADESGGQVEDWKGEESGETIDDAESYSGGMGEIELVEDPVVEESVDIAEIDEIDESEIDENVIDDEIDEASDDVIDENATDNEAGIDSDDPEDEAGMDESENGPKHISQNQG